MDDPRAARQDPKTGKGTRGDDGDDRDAAVDPAAPDSVDNDAPDTHDGWERDPESVG